MDTRLTDFDAWQQMVPAEIRQDLLWRIEAYRLALFWADIAWSDVAKLIQDRRTRGITDQLYRSVGSVSANIAEGFSRGTGRDRARFYEYALGSAREARDWHFKTRHILASPAVEQRIQLATQVIRLLLRMVPQQRGGNLRETDPTYTSAESERFEGGDTPSHHHASRLHAFTPSRFTSSRFTPSRLHAFTFSRFTFSRPGAPHVTTHRFFV